MNIKMNARTSSVELMTVTRAENLPHTTYQTLLRSERFNSGELFAARPIVIITAPNYNWGI